MSPGCRPSRQAPVYLPSMTVLLSRMSLLSGGSKVADVSVWYAESPIIVITPCDLTTDSPSLHSASVMNFAPSRRMSIRVHISFCMPALMSSIAFCVVASRQIVAVRGGLPAAPNVVVISHCPFLRVGKSAAPRRRPAPPRRASGGAGEGGGKGGGCHGGLLGCPGPVAPVK